MQLLARLIAIILSCSFVAAATPIVTSTLNTTLTTGSLAGTTFPVVFSYDAGQILPTGYSYSQLDTFDFNLLGTPFDEAEIFQGGQVEFLNGVFSSVTASYQVHLPPGSPVENITFGFGGPGFVAYIDNMDQYGMGSFTLATSAAPETSTVWLCILPLSLLAFNSRRVR